MSFANFYCFFPFPLSPPLVPLAFFLSPLHLLCKRGMSHKNKEVSHTTQQQKMHLGIRKVCNQELERRRDLNVNRGVYQAV